MLPMTLVLNARSQVTWAGWHYLTSPLGAYATIPGIIANPVSPDTIPGFEGGVGGIPTAVQAAKGSLWMALDDDGDCWVMRGEFGPETRNTRMPVWSV